MIRQLLDFGKVSPARSSEWAELLCLAPKGLIAEQIDNLDDRKE